MLSSFINCHDCHYHCGNYGSWFAGIRTQKQKIRVSVCTIFARGTSGHVGITGIIGENMKWRGSYTVEAAVIIPVLIWTMAAAMCTGIDLLHEVREEHEEKQMEDMWAVDSFYQYQILKEVKK